MSDDPEALTVNVTGEPCVTDVELGCVTIDGAPVEEMTVNVAVLLNIVPAELDTLTL